MRIWFSRQTFIRPSVVVDQAFVQNKSVRIRRSPSATECASEFILFGKGKLVLIFSLSKIGIEFQ